MQLLKHIKIIITALVVMCFSNLKSQSCISFDKLTFSPNTYNSVWMYPAGSVLHQYGDVKMINLNDAQTNPTYPTTLDSITNLNALHFGGGLLFDVSDVPYECKRVSLITGSRYVVVDQDTFDMAVTPVAPVNLNDSVTVYVDYSTIIISGQFSNIRLSLWSPSFVSDFCIEECIDLEYCEVDFEYSINNNIVDFTSTSSVPASEADIFIWDFTAGSYSPEEEITHSFSEEGKHEVCLLISLSTCINGPSIQKCDSIEITFDPIENTVEQENTHFTLSPNDDGIQDFIDLEAGSKIFDRNGNFIVEFHDNTQWNGTGRNNYLLPTGLYTVMLNNKTFQITIVR